MKHLFKRSVAMLILLAMLLSIAPLAAFAVEDTSAEFVLLTTTDMHGRVWDKNVLNDTNMNNSMLNVATAVKEIRGSYANVIVLDNGDTYQGTPVSTYQLSLQKQGLTDLPNPMALCLKEIGFDAATIGNHEFNYAWDLMEEVRAYLADGTQGNVVESLCANLYYEATGENVFTPYMFKNMTLGGKTYKIAIIGFENTDCPRWDVPDNYPGIVFTHPDNTTGSIAWEAEKYVAEVKAQGADLVIVAYHSGLGDGADPDKIQFGVNSENQILSVIKNNTGIDMIVAGHDHSSSYSGNTYTDKEGKEVLVVNGAGNNLTKTVFAVNAEGKLYIKSNSVIGLSTKAADADLKAKIAPYVELASGYVNQECGTILAGDWSKSTKFYLQQTDTMDIVGRAQMAMGTKYLAEKYNTESKVAELFAATGLDHLTVDMSSTSVVVSGNYTVQPGTMTMKKIYQLYKYDNTLYLIPLTGQQIKDVLEFNASERLSVSTSSGTPSFGTKGDDFTNPIFYGLDFVYDMSEPVGSRAEITGFANGKEFKLDETYIFAVNNYHLGNGPFADYSTDDAIWSQTDDLGGGVVQDLIAEWLTAETKAKGGVSPAPSNWEIVYDSEVIAGKAEGEFIGNYVDPSTLEEGDEVLIYYPAGNTLVSNVANGPKIAPSEDVTTGLSDKGERQAGTNTEANIFTIHKRVDGKFAFIDAEGKFLTAGATGNSLSLEETLNDFGYWSFETTENGYYVLNEKAVYNGNKQYLEYYNDFTTYGLQSGGAIYTFQFYKITQLDKNNVFTNLGYAPQDSKVVIYYPQGGTALAKTTVGNKVAASAVTVAGDKLNPSEDTAIFDLVWVDADNFTLQMQDGTYLTAGATGNSLCFSAEATDYSKWYLTRVGSTKDTFMVVNTNASYNGNAQALEFYTDGFTTYGVKEADAYYFQLFVKEGTGSGGSGGSGEEEPKDTVILFTNDIHTYIGNEGMRYSDIAALKSKIYAEGNNVYLVDAGDHIQGTAYGSMDKGETIIELMNAAGYDYATLGNHEFDYGMDRILELMEKANFPYLSANFHHISSGEGDYTHPVALPFVISKQSGGKEIAFIGITTPESFTKSTPAYFMDENGNYIYGISGGTDGQELYDSVQYYIDRVKEWGAEYVIALGHLGDDPSSEPWTSESLIANVSGLDAFIDGHSHSSVISKEVLDKDGNTVLLSQTGEYLNAVGKMTITAEGELSVELITDYKDNSSGNPVRAIEDAWIAEVDGLLGEVIAKNEVDFRINGEEGRLIRKQETNLGDFCADALYYLFEVTEGLGADLAIMNGGGIRADMAAGDISYKTTKTVHTFGNVACLIEVTGQQILDALEWGAKNVGTGENGGFLHVSGVTYEIHSAIPSTVQADDKGVWCGAPVGEYRVKNVKIGGEDLDLTKTYKLAGYNYTLRDLGDGFAMFEGATNIKDYVMEDYMVLANYAKSFPEGTIKADNSVLGANYGDINGEGRIVIVSESAFENPFTDLYEGAWYYDYVVEAAKLGLVNGMKEGIFDPEGTLTRAQFATILYRLEGAPSVEGMDNPFTDLDYDWYKDAVIYMYSIGVIKGVTETTFVPDANITREQMVTMLYRLSGQKYEKEVDFSDFEDGDIVYPYAAEALAWAVDAKLINGVVTYAKEGIYLEPQGLANRAQAAKVVLLYAQLMGK